MIEVVRVPDIMPLPYDSPLREPLFSAGNAHWNYFDEELKRTPESVVYMAIQDEEFRAVANLRLSAGEPEAFVRTMVTGQIHRRSGYGSYLLTSLMHSLQADGYERMNLVANREATLPFYTKLGFTASGLRCTRDITGDLPPVPIPPGS